MLKALILSSLFFSALVFIANKPIEETHTPPSFVYENFNGGITGRVIVPVEDIQRRRFRGSSYRNRGNSASTSSESENQENNIGNTIVSAHPISFSLPNDISGEAVIIDQKDAVFIPNVTPVTVGTVVQFVNNDPFFHNVFSLTPGSRFNIGRRPTGDVYSKQIEAPKWKVTGIGPITLFCDVHSQMKATILSLDTPYFTRLNEDGTYELNDLPEGTYELRVYNPGFELESKEITISSDKNIESNFNLTS
ncbi:MAG: carboxypeptidase-like regulatory domain-containing protein [Balneola sp.]